MEQAGTTGTTSPIYEWDFTIKAIATTTDFGAGPTVYKPSPQDIIEELKENCKKWGFQLEKGENTGYIHYQGRASLINKSRAPWKGKHSVLDRFEGVHWSPTCIKNKGDYSYVTKSETRINGPWKWDDKEDDISTEMPDDLKEILTDIKWYPWQQDMINLTSEKPNRRQVNILVDTKGSNGKSILTSWFAHQPQCYRIPFANNNKDLNQLVCCKLRDAKEKNPKVMIIDMTRAIDKDNLSGLFSGIEAIKDGFVYDLRNKYKEWTFSSPHIWVMTNQFPNKEYLSANRWNIYGIHLQSNKLVRIDETLIEIKPDYLKQFS